MQMYIFRPIQTKFGILYLHNMLVILGFVKIGTVKGMIYFGRK